MDIFVVRLKELRIESDLTQKQLAQIIGVSDDCVYQWEKGRSQPSIQILRKICKTLDISADYLIGVDTE